jgi:hypothetical protein
MLNDTGQKSFHFTIVDLVDDDGNTIGTKVVIELPIQFLDSAI